MTARRRISSDPQGAAWGRALAREPLAAAFGLALALTSGAARAGAPPVQDDAPPPGRTADEAKARAAQAVARGQQAFAAGDFKAAIDAFTEALMLRPAAKLHYNIGVCHQRLMQAAALEGDAALEAGEASAAIVSFNRYLAARPDAEDRAEVEALVRSLGGVPVVPPKPAAGASAGGQAAAADAASDAPSDATSDAPSDAASDAASDATSDAASDAPSDAAADAPSAGPAEGQGAPAEAARTPPAPLVPRGSFGPYLGLAAVPQLADNAAVEGGGLAALGLRGDARLGPRRRLGLGGELELASGGNSESTRLGLATQGLALVVAYHLPIGAARRVELPFALGAGVSREAVRTRGALERPACASASGTLVGRRVGGRVSGRLGIAVLVGARRNHGLGLLVGAVLTAYGRGPLAEGCSEAVFAGLEIPRARVAVGLDLAYTFRF